MIWLRRSIGYSITLVVFITLVVLIVITADRLDRRPRTDDAFLQADLVHMASDVSGRVVTLNVRDNQFVRRGDLLFIIDPEPYRLRVEEAAFQVNAMVAQLAVDTNQVAAQGSKATAASTGVGTARAQLILANKTEARLVPLGARGYVPAEQVDQARTAQRTAAISLLQAEEQAQQARQAVSSTKPLEEQLQSARASLALAERDLRLTSVRSPCDGTIAGLDVSAGEYAATGKALFTIIDTERWYAIGNFRETDLVGLRAGQNATVYVLSQPHEPLHGVVESLGWGVKPDEDETTGGLPEVPRSLNWVRIAQRYPVRVLLDRPPVELMRVAASAAVVIDR